MQSIKISVIVPSYNQGAFISNVINSVIGQTYENWELIIQDGASKDETAEVCSRYQSSDNRIRFFSEKDSGFADAVNKALKKATGTLAVIQSSDDFFATKFVFEEVISLYKGDNQLLIITGGAVVVDENLNHLKTEISNFVGYIPVESIFTTQNHFHQSSTFFNIQRALYIGSLDPSVDMVADTDFWIRMACTEPVRINSVLRTSKIWGAVLVQPEQRSNELSKFYLGRVKMAMNHLENEQIKFGTLFKKQNVNNSIIAGINHFKINNLECNEFEDYFYEVNGVKYVSNDLNKKYLKKIVKRVLKRILNLKSNVQEISSPNSIVDFYFNKPGINSFMNLKWFNK